MTPRFPRPYPLDRARLLAGSAAMAIALSASPARSASADEIPAVPPLSAAHLAALQPQAAGAHVVAQPVDAQDLLTWTAGSGLADRGTTALRLQTRSRPSVRIAAAALAYEGDEIVNEQPIEGDVILGDDDDAFYQKLGGSVSGTVDLGGGDDVFWIEQRGDTLAPLPAGGLSGGEGLDRFGIRLTASGTVDPGALPTGFERFALDLCGCDVVATIAEGTIAGGLDVTGTGTVTSLATITYEGAGAALTVSGEADETGRGLNFVNRGRIEATGTDSEVLVDVGYSDYHYGSFVNEGAIVLDGSYQTGMGVSAYSLGLDGLEAAFVNKGEITGSGDDSVTLDLQGSGANEGQIRATGADSTAVSLGYYAQLENRAGATISGTGSGVVLNLGARLDNAGVVEGGSGAGVTVNTADWFGRSTFVNAQGGTVRAESGVAVDVNGGGGLALANRGTLAGDVNLGGGSDVAWLGEGSTVQGDLAFGGGDDTLIVSIDRLSAAGVLDTAGLVTGSLDTGAGSDTLWLRAGASGTRDVFTGAVAGFEDGLVYEAAGAQTELVLRNGSVGDYEGVLRLAGDGRVVVDMGVTGSIVVSDESSATHFGEGVAALDLVLAAGVQGQVDATYARRVELRADAGGIGFTGGTGLKTGYGTEVLVGDGTEIRKSGASAGILLDADGSLIVNRGTLAEDDKAATASNVSTGVRLSSGVLRNERGAEGTGRIAVLGTAVEVDEGSMIVNDGEIVSGYANAIEATGYGTTRIVNGAQGVITGHAQGYAKGLAGAAIVGAYGREAVENAGTINGHVALGGGEDLYVAAGGTVDGDIDLGSGDDMLLVRGGAALNLSGALVAGEGIDAYGQSFTQSGTFDLGGNGLPTGFEMHGVEAAGIDVAVTVTSATTQAHGLRATGSGTVRNEANFDIPEDGSGGYAGIEVRGEEAASTLRLVNAGKIVSAFDGVDATEGLASFANAGEIEAQGDGVVIYAEYGNAALGFDNSGKITSHRGAAARIYTDSIGADGQSLAFTNAGQMVQTADDGRGLELDNYGGKAVLANSGSISAAGEYGRAVDLRSEGTLAFTNSGMVEASGRAGTGMLVRDSGDAPLDAEDCPEGEATPQVTAKLVNTGTVRASGPGASGEGYADLSTGLLAVAERDYGIISVDNQAGGVIEATGTGSVAVLVVGGGSEGYGTLAALDEDGYGGGNVDAELRFFELDNAGVIRGGADTVIGEDGYAYAGGESLSGLEPVGGEAVIAGGIQTIDTTDRIVNRASGTIIGNVSLGAGDDVFESYGTLQGDLDLGSGDDSLVYGVTSQFSGIAHGGSGTDTLVVDLNGQGSVDFDQFRGFETLSQRGAGSVSIRGTTDMDALTIAGSSVTVAAGATFDAQSETVLLGSDAAEQVTVAGTVGGAIALGGGSDVVTLQQGGLVQGAIDLGTGDDRLVLQGGTATGLIDGGEGIDTVAFQIAGTVSGLPDVINFESLDVAGEGLLTIAAAQDFSTITLRDGADLTLTAGEGAHTIGAIIGDDSAQTVTLRAPLTGSVSLGGGDDLLDIELQGTLSGALDGGAGNDTLALQLTGAATIAGGIANFETINVNGASPLTLGGTIGQGQTLNFDGGENTLIVAGGSIQGVANGGAGADTIAFDTAANQTSTLAGGHVVNFETLLGLGAGTLVVQGNAAFDTIAIEGNLVIDEGAQVTSGTTTMGAGNNVLTLEGNATLSGAIEGGEGTDRLVLFQNAQQVRKFSSVDATGFEEMESGGPGELVIDRNAAFDVVDLLGAKMTIDAGSTLTVPVLAGGAAANHLAVLGTVTGNVDLGEGDDRLTLASLGGVSGSRSGGAGTDTLELRTGGTATAPTEWNGTGFDSFERFELGSGSLRLTGNTAYQRVTVAGGTLWGSAGTTITSAETLVVAQGAVFGSAGKVVGDIEVRGTLAPGNSPGTMTVEGNVSFLAGSRLALEVLPTAHDLLDISGKLTIAGGTTMDITGALGSSPVGGAIDLIVADGGITGGFTTINKSETIFGYVVTRGNRVQIVGEFQNDDDYATNVQTAIDYANGLLGDGQMVQAFTGILPQLTDATGAIRPEGFARLTPESYATASQASIDNGLAVTDALRTVTFTAPSTPGWYGFAQGLAQWSRQGGDAGTGASSAKSDTQGALGGIGYATEQGSRFGAWIGGIGTTQEVDGLGARTKLDGVIVGAFADVAVGGLGLHAALAYDASDAKTTRSVRPQETITGKYDLGGFVADAAVSYDLEVGDWSVRPQAGVTWVEGRRDAVRETGSAFALDVAEGKANAWFADASVTLGRQAGMLRPWVEVGLRHRLDDASDTATGGFAAVSDLGAMTVDGAETDRTRMRLGAGVSAQLSDSLRLNLGYRAEFGDHARHNLTGGVSFRF
ncbi:autotransporter domain-containing protein [Novosphingobium soli]|uniref:Autotransporter domain-containing protein n=1 Tax=Novosphingobium soli TaxID=574956 RepID=A0ABV6CRV3_9SPHN